MEKICEFCEKTFEIKDKRSRFCGRSCSNSWQHKNKVRRNYLNDKTTWDWWVEKYGLEEAILRKELHRKSVSKATMGEKNPMYGKNYQTHGLLRENQRRKGRTFDEIFGIEKSLQIRSKWNRSGENNSAFGKIYEKGGKSKIQGVFRGLRFRSSYEIAFLVSCFKEGLTPEIPERIHYVLDGKNRTYTPDFKLGNLIIEIKPTSMLGLKENKAKFKAANEFCLSRGLEFKVYTEENLTLILLEDLLKIDGINWNKGALEYINGKITCD